MHPLTLIISSLPVR